MKLNKPIKKGKKTMSKYNFSKTDCYIIAGGIILFDLIFVFLPITAFFLGAVIIFKPKWFKDILDSLYASS